MSDTTDLIRAECEAIARMLIEKNRAYGDSALKPMGIFARGDAQDLIRVRIDDKLNRIRNGADGALGEDAVLDLIGYLVLLRIAQQETATHERKPGRRPYLSEQARSILTTEPGLT